MSEIWRITSNRGYDTAYGSGSRWSWTIDPGQSCRSAQGQKEWAYMGTILPRKMKSPQEELQRLN